MPKPTTQTNLNEPYQNEPYQNDKAQTNAQYNNNISKSKRKWKRKNGTQLQTKQSTNGLEIKNRIVQTEALENANKGKQNGVE